MSRRILFKGTVIILILFMTGCMGSPHPQTDQNNQNQIVEDIRNKSDIEIVGSNLKNNSLLEGENVEVSVRLKNTGNSSGFFTLNLTRKSETLKKENVSVPAKKERNFTVTETVNTVGIGELFINNISLGMINVSKPKSDIEIVDLSLDKGEINSGENIEVSVLLKNNARFDGIIDLSFKLGNKTIQRRDVSVSGKEEKKIVFTERIENPGIRNISINSQSLGEIQVAGAPKIQDVSLVSDWHGSGDLEEKGIDHIVANGPGILAFRSKVWRHGGSIDITGKLEIYDPEGNRKVVRQREFEELIGGDGYGTFERVFLFNTSGWDPYSGSFTAKIIIKDDIIDETSETYTYTFDVTAS